MSDVGIFIYGVVVTSLVATALGLLTWGLVNERRDRRRTEQGQEVFGEPAAAFLALQRDRPPDSEDDS